MTLCLKLNTQNYQECEIKNRYIEMHSLAQSYEIWILYIDCCLLWAHSVAYSFALFSFVNKYILKIGSNFDKQSIAISLFLIRVGRIARLKSLFNDAIARMNLSK